MSVDPPANLVPGRTAIIYIDILLLLLVDDSSGKCRHGFGDHGNPPPPTPDQSRLISE